MGLGQPVPFRQRFSHLSIGLPLSFLSGLFVEITSPPFSRGGRKPSPLPTPVTYFPRRYRDCDPFCRARERPKLPNSVVRHSTFAPQMQQADRPTDRPRRGSPLCRNALLTLRLHSFWRGIFHSEGYYWSAKGPALKSFRNGTGWYFHVIQCVLFSIP